MQATAMAHETQDERRQAHRVAELIGTASEVLREEIAEGGAMSRTLDRLARVARSLEVDHGDDTFTTAVQATHHALSDALRIGSAVVGALEPRGKQCIDSLAAAQRILYPVAQAHGVVAPPPLPEPSRPVVEEGDEEAPLPTGVERRTSPRVDVAVEVGFETEDNFYQGFSEDVSDGGLFVATYQLAPIGTKMDVEFTLPNGHIVRARATVRWHRDPREASADIQPGMGLQFEALLPEDERAIGEFVRARNPIFFDDDV